MTVRMNVNVILVLKVTEKYVTILTSVLMKLIIANWDSSARTALADLYAKISMNVKLVMNVIRMLPVLIQLDHTSAHAIEDM